MLNGVNRLLLDGCDLAKKSRTPKKVKLEKKLENTIKREKWKGNKS